MALELVRTRLIERIKTCGLEEQAKNPNIHEWKVNGKELQVIELTDYAFLLEKIDNDGGRLYALALTAGVVSVIVLYSLSVSTLGIVMGVCVILVGVSYKPYERYRKQIDQFIPMHLYATQKITVHFVQCLKQVGDTDLDAAHYHDIINRVVAFFHTTQSLTLMSQGDAEVKKALAEKLKGLIWEEV